VNAPAADPFREQLLDRRLIHQGRYLTVVEDEVRFEDGRRTHREVVEHPGAVCIVAIDEQGRVALVRQWRHPVGRALWELPAGTRDKPGETPLEAAKRELAEEACVAAREWRALATLAVAPGYSTEVMHFFVATSIAEQAGDADPDEQIETAWYTADEVRGLIAAGEVDVKTVAGLAAAGFWVSFDG
jgi:8-oxo-dGTP pyrophosphatase MutT (NUDIX family)